MALSACGDDGTDGQAAATNSETTTAAPTTGGDAAGKTVDVTIKGDTVSPQAEQLQVGVGDKITLQVTSDRDGEIHVHSSPEHEFEVKPGRNTFSFTLDQPGQVDVEEHESDTLVLRITAR